MVSPRGNVPDIILTRWTKEKLTFFFAPIPSSSDDEQAEIEAEVDAYPELREDPHDQTQYPIWNKHDGNYYMEGKLDKTYFFTFKLSINGNKITGFYYTRPKTNNPAGVVTGQVEGDRMHITVSTNGKISRTFTGVIQNNIYSGSFISGYNGAKRTFRATLNKLGY